ncbi:hypothetical protein CLV46_2957 [Diaminobutyricimonas aerilata]|uniref:DUF4232 domain-containing protein n=1 Tax=Diaminobutyricimonas aerilata TaxID=1162967 RepID=A0A2M9CN99_9MICO|nr:hypothetical protein [Diaminobutyricimonas aerilata]PJJ73370.1 hypothetical protein CLV46_2957 [Diaminobutyricimonas aerilata]
MSTFRNPVGPQPAKVYWRRRLIVLLGLLAVILVIVLIVVRPGSAQSAGGDDKPADTAGTAESSSPTPEPIEADGDAPACSPGSVTLTAVTDKGTYAPEETPQLSFSLVNTGTAPCLLPVGSDVQEYVITSGPDTIWSSKHCQSAPQAQEMILQPNEPVSPAPIPWDRTRSDPSTCEAERPLVPGGGASYHLAVTVGEITSDETRQFLLN